jgi:hypothetical protein
MSNLKYALFIFLFTTSVQGGWFGISDSVECNEKYRPKLKYREAMSLLRNACNYGYEDINPDMTKSARCIAAKTTDIYSHDSALKVINDCVKDDLQLFRFWKYRIGDD